MTSKERAQALIDSLEKKLPPGLNKLLRVHIVDKEQNGTASGGDKSLTENEWYALRDLASALGAVYDAIGRFKNNTAPPKAPANPAEYREVVCWGCGAVVDVGS